MTISGFDHVGVVVRDLPAAVRFFADLGFAVQGPAEVEPEWIEKVAGVRGVRSELFGVSVPGERVWLELTAFSPAGAESPVALPADALGYRHIAYQVTDVDAIVQRARAAGFKVVNEVVDYEDTYRLVYIRGPEGLLVEFAQPLDGPGA